jgi:outer membrane protein
MKRFSTLLLVGFFVLSASFLYAADDQKIGVVELDRVYKESNEGKRIAGELDAFLKGRQDTVNEKATEVEKLQKSVEAETDPPAKAKKNTEYNKAATEYQKLLSSSQTDIQKKNAELRTAFLGEVRKTVESLSTEEKLGVVLTSEAALYFQKTVNITDKVIKKLDETKKGK